MSVCRWFHRLILNTLLLIAVLAPVSGAPTVAAAQTLSVDGSAPAASDTTCAPCKTIQGALNLAGPGASITVAPGTYPETLTITQSVSITGGVPFLPSEQGPTIVDAGGTGSVVTIPNTVPPDVLVSLTSLTLTDGIAPSSAGGLGGGIAALAGAVSLSDTTIMSNTASQGGGIVAFNVVTLTDSRVMSNTATYAGGGIFDDANAVTLTDSAVMSNTTTGLGGSGGGIDAYDNAVTLTGSLVMSNTATYGGGIHAVGPVTRTGSPVMNNTGGGISGGTVTLTDSPVMNNTGGGISGNTVTLTGSPVISNGAGMGGGIYSVGRVTLTDSPVMSNRAATGGGIVTFNAVTLTNSSVMSNTATNGLGGGLVAYGAVLVLTSTIAGNTASSGGGLAAQGTGATLTLRNSAVLRNTARSGDGGGILNSGSLNIINSTLSANTAAARGGGAIASTGSLALSFSTVSANSALYGGGIAATGGTTTLNATILAGNTGGDCAGAVTSLGDNLVGNADGCGGFRAPGDLTGSGAHPLDPRLGPLADNGGPTWTMALQPGSPAFAAVPLANCSVTTDQRGQPRPDPLYTGACDSGAIEVPAVAPPTSTPTRTPTSTPTRTPTVVPTRTPTPTSAATSAPRLALVPTSAHAGDRVRVAGSGFGPNELLTLALNGEALAPTPLRTSGQGSFTATFTAPDGLLTGANTVSVVGTTSRRVALAMVRGQRSTQTYYLAGGVESSTEHAALDLLNTSAQRAHVGYTLYSQTGDTTRGTLTVGGHAVRMVPVSSLTHLRGSVGLALSADRPIAAQLSLTRQGLDGDTILASPGTAWRWYLPRERGYPEPRSDAPGPGPLAPAAPAVPERHRRGESPDRGGAPPDVQSGRARPRLRVDDTAGDNGAGAGLAAGAGDAPHPCPDLPDAPESDHPDGARDGALLCEQRAVGGPPHAPPERSESGPARAAQHGAGPWRGRRADQ